MSKAFSAIALDGVLPAAAVIIAAAILSFGSARWKAPLARSVLAAAACGVWWAVFGDIRPWVDSNHAVVWAIVGALLLPFASAVSVVSVVMVLWLLQPLVETWGWPVVLTCAVVGGGLSFPATRPARHTRPWLLADALLSAGLVGFLGAGSSLRLAESAAPLMAALFAAVAWSGKSASASAQLAQALRSAQWVATFGLLTAANAYGDVEPLSAIPLVALLLLRTVAARAPRRTSPVADAPPLAQSASSL